MEPLLKGQVSSQRGSRGRCVWVRRIARGAQAEPAQGAARDTSAVSGALGGAGPTGSMGSRLLGDRTAARRRVQGHGVVRVGHLVLRAGAEP